MASKTFVVPNITCGHCVATIKREIGALKGIREVAAEAHTKTVTVAWDAPTTWGDIDNILQEIGYPPAE